MAAFLTSKTKVLDTIPIVPPVTLRKIRLSEFDSYLSSISEVIDKYNLHKALGSSATEGIPILDDAESLKEEEELEKAMGLIPLKQAPSMDRLNRTRMLSSTPNKSFKQIPPIFSQPGFDLGNPHTFSTVYEFKDIIGLNTTEESSLYRTLQDKLTLYRDTIEIQLLKEISTRSHSFFTALTNLQQLETETTKTIDKIKELRKALVEMNERNVKPVLKVCRLKQLRSNLIQLYSVVKSVGQIKQTQPVIQLLISQSDYVGALDLIEETGTFLKGDLARATEIREQVTNGVVIVKNTGQSQRKLDLRGVTSVMHLSTHLLEVIKNLENLLENEFVMTLTKDLRSNLEIISCTPYTAEQLPQRDTGNIVLNSIRAILTEQYTVTAVGVGKVGVLGQQLSTVEIIPPNFVFSPMDIALKNTLTPIVYGLLRLDQLDTALRMFKDSIFKEIKSFSKQVVHDLYSSV